MGPHTMEIYPTMRCNLDCKYCDTAQRNLKPGEADELSVEDVQGIVQNAIRLDLKKLSILGGGEPLEAAQATLSAIRIAKDAGIQVTLGTNATLLDGSMAEEIVNLGLDELHVSLDGPDGETHDQLTIPSRGLHLQ
ncbi:MAG: radical SAM protein [Deltaproteobacteria bacterium]|nr:radical SAM protein [Deltaproteobacteria bacterium]